jgi:hypothetical protein
MRPVKYAGAQLDGGAVQRQQPILKSKLFPVTDRLTLGQEIIEEPFIAFPRSVSICVGESGAFGFLLQSQMLEFAFPGLQSVGDFPQRARLRKLAKEHRHELIMGRIILHMRSVAKTRWQGFALQTTPYGQPVCKTEKGCGGLTTIHIAFGSMESTRSTMARFYATSLAAAKELPPLSPNAACPGPRSLGRRTAIWPPPRLTLP